MGTVTTQWVAEFVDGITAPVNDVTEAANEAAGAIDSMGEAANGAAEEIHKLSAMDLKATADAIKDLTGQFEELMKPGEEFEVQMKSVQAITQQTDEEMSQLGDSARELAKQFGGDASSQLESFGAIIARFGPSIAQDQRAMESMGNSVSTLSKLMNNDAVGAMDALTTAMLQFGVDLSNPQEAAGEMARMMNVMAAAGNEGASEVSDTAEALKQAGILAKQANVTFEETNAALQALAQGGRVGSEAGVSLRNVLSKMSGIDVIPKQAQEKIRALGIDYDIVSNKALPFITRLQELKKAQVDSTLIAQIFNVENAAAANILLDNIESQREMAQAITNTNAAYESADIVMSSTAEKASRMTAWFDDLKISIFDVAGSLTPFVVGLGAVAFTVANMAAAYTGIKQLIVFTKSLTIATHLQTAAQWALNAAQALSPTTWIIAGVVALTAAVAVCWNKFEGFRKIVMGVWEVMKGFGNILKDFVIDRIKGIISGVGAIGEAIMKLFDGDFSGAWESAKRGAADLTGFSAIKNAKDSFSNMNIAELYNEGAAKGVASLMSDNSKSESHALSPMQAFQSGQTVPLNSNVPIVGSNFSGNGSNNAVKLKGVGGSGGNKSVVMNVNVNFPNFKGVREVAEAVAKEINNRLSDGLAVMT